MRSPFSFVILYFDIHDRAWRKVLYAVAALSKSSNVDYYRVARVVRNASGDAAGRIARIVR